MKFARVLVELMAKKAVKDVVAGDLFGVVLVMMSLTKKIEQNRLACCFLAVHLANVMTKFRKKPVVVDAEQFFIDIEIDGVESFDAQRPDDICKYCHRSMKDHGYVDTPFGGTLVCIEDWLITHENGDKYPCKPDIFEQTYEKVVE